jgi:hypothetical protein
VCKSTYVFDYFNMVCKKCSERSKLMSFIVTGFLAVFGLFIFVLLEFYLEDIEDLVNVYLPCVYRCRR